MKPTPLSLLATLAIAACVAAPEERAAACRATDWHRYGVNDGRLGVAAAARDAKFADCRSLGTAADTTAYAAGRTEGLASFCTAESGYRQGHAGRRYRKVCPPALEPDFLHGYELGRRERPSFFLVPGFSIGVGGGGVRSGVGIGVGTYPYYHGRPCWSGWYRHCR